MHTTNLRKVGGSVMLAIPPVLLDLLRLKPGARVGVAIKHGRLVIKPDKRPRYTLDELLAQSRPKRARSMPDREWLDSQPAGRELV